MITVRNYACMTTILLMLLSVGVFAQKHRRAEPVPAMKEFLWPKWNFAFTGPASWRMYLENVRDNKVVENGFHDETRYFTRQPAGPKIYPSSDLTITFTTWPGPTVSMKGPTRVHTFTAEQLMEGEQGTPESWAADKSPQLEAIRYETLDGVKGVLLQRMADEPGKVKHPTDELVLYWVGYRLYQGNVQRISVAFECRRSGLPLAQKILSSFRFSK